jgi:ribose transport system permease protein
MTIAIICGEFDLSCGALLGVVTILFTDIAKKTNVVSAIMVCVCFCIVVGLINGFLVAKVKMSAFVATLATSIALKGFALNYTSGKPINYVNNEINRFGNGTIFGIPVIVLFFIGALLITMYVLRYTKFGREIYATGGNIEVARMAGINVSFYKIAIFVILGIATAAAGILMAARLSAGNALYGSDLSMTVVAAVVIGGTSLSGGKGSALKTLWGMLVIGVLFNALMILGVQANWQNVLKGAILIGVVAVDAIFSKKKLKLQIAGA